MPFPSTRASVRAEKVESEVSELCWRTAGRRPFPSKLVTHSPPPPRSKSHGKRKREESCSRIKVNSGPSVGWSLGCARRCQRKQLKVGDRLPPR